MTGIQCANDVDSLVIEIDYFNYTSSNVFNFTPRSDLCNIGVNSLRVI